VLTQTQTSPKHLSSGLQPASAWVAILSLILLTTVLAAAGAGKILNLLFPAGSFCVALLLYFRAPLLYMGFTWWVCFLTPLVRRLADYRGGFTDPSPILLAPYLVILVSLITLWKHLPTIHREQGVPFVLAIAGSFYGFLVGLIFRPPVKAVLGALGWISPILLGFHLYSHWRDYPQYRQNIQRTFIWSVLVMGGYGVVQYLVAPEWDRFWMTSVDLTSIGSPEPLKIRVWSTMNAPEPFSAVMAGALLLLLTTPSPIILPASVVGYLSFLLTLARAAWAGWFVGVLSLIGLLKPKFQLRLAITMIAMVFLTIPLVMIEPFSEVINNRLQSFTDLANDDSASDRQETYGDIMDTALSSFLGEGVGGPSYDSTILSFLLDLGWFGTFFYVGGLSLLLVKFYGGPQVSDPFVSTTRAIVLTTLIRLPVNASALGISGLLMWGFLGLGLAGLRYNTTLQSTLKRPRQP